MNYTLAIGHVGDITRCIHTLLVSKATCHKYCTSEIICSSATREFHTKFLEQLYLHMRANVKFKIELFHK